MGIVTLFGYRSWRRRRTEKEDLRKMARTFGFAFSEPETRNNFVRLVGGWEMSGKYNGVAVRIYGKKVSSGEDSSSESTFIDATANCRTKCELMITRETTLSRIGGALFGLQDISTGNADLDRRVVVKGVPTHVVERIVGNPRLQQEVISLFEREGMIHVDLHGAHYRQSRVFRDEQALRPLLESLTRTASALQEATE